MVVEYMHTQINEVNCCAISFECKHKQNQTSTKLKIQQQINTMSSERVNMILVNLASIMEHADGALLPGVYKEVGSALHIDPTGLGSLALYTSIVQTSCYPFAAYLARRHNRAHVVALGAFLWSAATFLFAFSDTYFQVAVSRALNGLGLAIATPAIQSLVADSTEDNHRGVAFGWLHVTGSIGSILGNLCSVLLASRSFMGIPGWRVAFHLVGLVSVIVGILVRLFAYDPRFSSNGDTAKGQIPGMPIWSEVKELIEEAKSVLRIPSFQVIVAQGVPGSFPMSGFSFAPMWFELIGFSHGTTASLVTTFIVANSLGGLFGGKMGDILSQRFPNSGRIVLAQISSSSGIPLAAILLLGLPCDPSTGFLHGLVLFIFGFCRSWVGPATNNPIFAEIVQKRDRTSIYAMDRMFESVLKSFAPPIVGILAQNVYGYKPAQKQGSTNSTAETEINKDNAKSLAKALYAAIGIPMTLCCLIFTFLYSTYPRDREAARLQARKEEATEEVHPILDNSEYQCVELEGIGRSPEFVGDINHL
ncbi:spinster-like protein [Drosera capensis]